MKTCAGYPYFSDLSFSHSATVLSDALDGNLLPESQLPEPAACLSSSPLFPMPELEEVQNGMTVFPAKSFAFIKPSTGHAAIPHQMG